MDSSREKAEDMCKCTHEVYAMHHGQVEEQVNCQPSLTIVEGVSVSELSQRSASTEDSPNRVED